MPAFTADCLVGDGITEFVAAVLAGRAAPAAEPYWVELGLTSAGLVITQLVGTVSALVSGAGPGNCP